MFRSDALTIAPMASTGPHSEECGEDVRRVFWNNPCIASTGPHSEECGELRTRMDARQHHQPLQRGRTPKSAESPPSRIAGL